MRINEIDIDREIVSRGGLYNFIKIAWPHVEPGPYKDNWHIPIVCEHLEAVSCGEIKRLVINVPPGTMKSLTTSVFWPVWQWLQDPTTKYMYASFDASLVGTLQGGKIIDLLKTKWFTDRWGKLLKDEAPAASHFEIEGGGFRFATSPGGKGTGRHVDIQVVDDPNKPQDVQGTRALTRKALDTTSNWWKGTASTRAVDAPTFRRVVLMQRLHEDDLAGEMLREGGYHHLCLPMRYETTVCACGNAQCTPEDKRTQEGELLWPERFPEEVVVAQESVGLGPAVAAAQYQQRPTPASGGIFAKSWFRYWHPKAGTPTPRDETFPCRDETCVALPEKGVWFQSWDMTFKGSDGSDFVSGAVWLFANPDFYLVHMVNRRMSFVESVRAVLEVTRKYPQAHTKLIEDKANGPGIVSMLGKQIRGLVLVNPQGGKEARAHAVSGLFEAGNVYIPHPDVAPWANAYRTQMTTFPRGVNDDMVDATTQGLLKYKQKSVPYAQAMAKLFGGKK